MVGRLVGLGVKVGVLVGLGEGVGVFGGVIGDVIGGVIGIERARIGLTLIRLVKREITKRMPKLAKERLFVIFNFFFILFKMT